MKINEECKAFFRKFFGSFSLDWKKQFIENTIREKYPEAEINLNLQYMTDLNVYYLSMDILHDGKLSCMRLDDIPYSKTVDDVYTLMCGIAFIVAACR